MPITNVLDLPGSWRTNLKQLADYLAALPEDYAHFDMRVYYWHYGVCPAFGQVKAGVYDLHGCGSVACALGHGPAAGIEIPEDCEYWQDYIDLFTPVPDYAPIFQWCFDYDWKQVDNSHQGAAKRIYWLLEKGIPEDGPEQMAGLAPLCYH
jgi:hypothetical protein